MAYQNLLSVGSNILFTGAQSNVAVNRTIGVVLSGPLAPTSTLTIDAGQTSANTSQGNTLIIRSGKGSDGTALIQAGAGGDVFYTGGDAGADNGAGGNHGGNVFVQGGAQTFNIGQSGFGEQGSVIIGETTTDEIRLGHDPAAGMDFGHVLFRGDVCPNRFSSFAQADWPSIQFESNPSFLANITTAARTVGNGATGIHVRCGQPIANFAAFAALIGGYIKISAGQGSDGNGAHPAGAGNDLDLFAGDAGINNGGGGANSGNIHVDAGAKSGAGTAGVVSIGPNNASQTLIDGGTISIGVTNATVVSIGRNNQTVSIFGIMSQDITFPGDGSTHTLSALSNGAGNGSALALRGGNSTGGNGGQVFFSGGTSTTGNGGSISILGGNAPAVFGGSVNIDAGSGTDAGHNGALDIGTTVASSVRIVKASGQLAFFTNSSAGVVQQTPLGITTAGFTVNVSANNVFAESTFTGNTGASAYTISDVIRCLKNYGLLAS